MTDRPILFSAPMVRALLDGRKTQTRRIVNPQPDPFVQHTPDVHPTTRTAPYLDAYCGEKKTPANPRGMGVDWHWWTADNRPSVRVARCPYGKPGDRLWVRETWAALGNEDGHPINAAGQLCSERDAERFYRSDAEGWEYGMEKMPGGRHFDGRWTPSIHMPRWASRITLEVTGVRVERLQEISEADANAEGAEILIEYMPKKIGFTHRQAYGGLWESINGPGSWDANPWVWVIEFRRVTP